MIDNPKPNDTPNYCCDGKFVKYPFPAEVYADVSGNEICDKCPSINASCSKTCFKGYEGNLRIRIATLKFFRFVYRLKYPRMVETS